MKFRKKKSLSAGSHYAIFACGEITPFITTNNFKSDDSDHVIFPHDKNLNHTIKNYAASCPSMS